MSFNHIHHTYPHPSPTPGTAQSYLVPPMDVDMDMDADLDQPKDQPTVDTIAASIQDFAVFPVASIPPGIQLASTRSRTRRASTVVPKTKTDANQRVVIAHAQSQFAVHAVRGLLKNTDSTNANDGDDESVDVYAMVQDTESPEAREIKALGATLLQYDPTSSSSIRSALGQSGSSTLLLIPPQVDDTVIRTSSILSEARHSIKSILMWSTIGTDNAMDLPPEDDIDPQRQPGGSKAKADSRVPSALLLLKEAEELVMHVEGGIEYVVLRAGFPLQHFFLLSALIQNRGSIPFTSETAHMAPISLTDFGRATALLIHHTLTSGSLPDDFKNKTVLLTGPEPLSGPMIVTAANERLPHPLTFAKVGISDMRSFLLQTHASRFELSLAMGWWRLFMDGKLDVATGDLSDMLGGPDKLTKIREFFSKHVDRFLPTDGERAGAATFVHETYDEWDVMSRESSSGSEQGEGGGSPSKLAAKVLRDTAPHRSPKHAGIKKSTSAKCISDTHHTYFSAATACRHSPARKPTMSTKVLAEARRSPSVSPSSSCSLDPYVALALGIIDTFHAGLIEVMLSTTNQLRALNASMPADLQSEVATAQVQTLIDRLAFMKDLVDACARDALRMAAPATTATAGNVPVQSGGMAAKVLGDIAGQHVCETCLKPARLVKKVIGDTERGSMAVETAGDEATTVASKVGVFAKVMHDVAEADVVEQPQQGSCVIQ